jgi:hypothetical protein
MAAQAIGSGQEKYVKADFRRQDLPIYLLQGAFRSDCLFRIEENERELTAVGPSPDGPVLAKTLRKPTFGQRRHRGRVVEAGDSTAAGNVQPVRIGFSALTSETTNSKKASTRGR